MSKPDNRKPVKNTDQNKGQPEANVYQWPPPRDPNLAYREKSQHPVHSVLTALPVLMLVIGFSVYYFSESRQNQGAPIRQESIDITGVFTGFSATSDRHYLWIERDNGVAKGVRVQAEQLRLLEGLEKGVNVELKIAPKVSQSKTYWAWQVEQSGQLLLDASATLE